VTPPPYERGIVPTGDVVVEHAVVRSPALGHRADLSTLHVAGTAPELVVVLLHGVYGSHWSWPARGGAADVLAAEVGAGRVPPMLLVTPSDGLWGWGSGYARIGEADHDAWIVDEVLDVVADMHGVGDRPVGIGGLSMGGYGALRLAGRHPDRFVAASGHSSVTRWAELRLFESMTPPADEIDDPDLADVLARAAPDLPPIRFDCGVDDLLIESNRTLHDALSAAGVDHEYVEHPGGHEWPYWQRHLPATLHHVARAAGVI
jgi:putative tributyrin esterase